MGPIERTPPPSRGDKIEQSPSGQIGPHEFIPPPPKTEQNKPILKTGSNSKSSSKNSSRAGSPTHTAASAVDHNEPKLDSQILSEKLN